MTHTSATRPGHLLTVWNPSYATDPLDEHLRILLHWAEQYRQGECGDEDVYVWWAKLRSPNRDAPTLPHHAEIMAPMTSRSARTSGSGSSTYDASSRTTPSP